MKNGVIPKPMLSPTAARNLPKIYLEGDPSLRLKNGSAQDDAMGRRLRI
jgi:hypothetical protein